MRLDVREIIEIEKEDLEIIKSSLNQKLFIFLGAGVSKQVGYKLWDELVKEVIEKFWGSNTIKYSMKELLLNYNNKLFALDYVKNINKDNYIEIIKKIFAENQNNENSEILEKLKPFLNNKNIYFIQTNLDDSFERYYGLAKQQISINPNFSEDFKLNYLHGHITKPETWILTQSEYMENYMSPKSKLYKFLEEIFRKYLVILIGYGFGDYEILQALSRANIQDDKKQNKKYALIPYSENSKYEIEMKQKIFESNFNLKFLLYNIENKGYAILKDNLEKLTDVLMRGTLKYVKEDLNWGYK